MGLLQTHDPTASRSPKADIGISGNQPTSNCADEKGRQQKLFVVQIASDSFESFRGTYPYSSGDLIAKSGFVSS
jgi:hypothetical protein